MTKHQYKYIENIYNNRILRKIIYNKQDIFGKSYSTTKLELMIGASMLPVFKDIWNSNNVQGNPGHFLFIDNRKLPTWQAMLSVVFGQYPKNKPLGFINTYKQAMKPKIIKFSEKSIDEYRLYEHGSPISLTRYDLEELGGGFGSLSSHDIYIGKLQAWEDLIEFWNLRATGKEIAYIPYEFYKEFKTTAVKFIDVGAYPINPQVQNSTVLAGRLKHF